MTLGEAAARLATSAAVLRQAIARGSLQAEKHGRDWWVTEAEVERYRRENRRARTSAELRADTAEEQALAEEDWNDGNPVIAKRELGSVTKRLLDAIERLDYGAYDAPRYADFDSWEAALAAVATDGQSGEQEAFARIVSVLEAHEFECLHDQVSEVHSMREVAEEIYRAIRP